MSIVIIGEAWGAEEEAQRTPFVGSSGYELTRMLEEAGIHRADCYLTNVLNFRPPGNKLEAILGSKAEAIRGYCLAVRSSLTDDGRPPLEASGLKLHERISAIGASLTRVSEKGVCRAS